MSLRYFHLVPKHKTRAVEKLGKLAQDYHKEQVDQKVVALIP